jgi:hypothetical protein
MNEDEKAVSCPLNSDIIVVEWWEYEARDGSFSAVPVDAR